MRIGINVLYLLPGQVGGTETYATGLIQGLAEVSRGHEFVVFVNQESAAWDVPDKAGFQKVVCPVRASRRGVRYAYEQLRLPRMLRRHGVDVVHSLGYVSPLHAPCPSVVTIHDLNYRACGRQMPLSRRLMLAAFVRLSAHACQRVVAVSEFSRAEILSAFRLPAQRVVAIHEAPLECENCPTVLWEQEAQRLGVVRPYVLAYGNKFPHKNIPRLIEAFGLARRSRNLPHQLVLVGHRPNNQDWDDLVRRSNLEGRVVFTGFLQQPVTQGMLSHAQMLAFPSLYEGFGLPVLEAMAAGVPVVCSNRAALPEVAGNAALFFDPLSIPQMAESMYRLATSPEVRARLIIEGRENLLRFSWREAAKQTLGVYDEARGRRGVELAGSMQPCYEPTSQNSRSARRGASLEVN